ncbi:hypothetical protein [Lacunimicrobium album]
MTIQEILAAAEELTHAEQVQLLGVMIERYSPPHPGTEFLAELHRRCDEMDVNPEASIDGPTVLAKARALIGRND